jgi:hypothetical protein
MGFFALAEIALAEIPFIVTGADFTLMAQIVT